MTTSEAMDSLNRDLAKLFNLYAKAFRIEKVLEWLKGALSKILRSR